MKKIFKISRHLAKLWVRKLIASSTICAGHCPAERPIWKLTYGGQWLL